MPVVRRTMKETLDTQGFAITPRLLDDAACAVLETQLGGLSFEQVGTRCLLSLDWCARLARDLTAHASLAGVLDADHVAVQCTLFQKSADRNWLVSYHRDLSIPVAERVDDPALQGWSQKEGALYVLAPQPVLRQLCALRLHVDACSALDGPLRVIPGSHLLETVDGVLSERLRAQEHACLVGKGAALLMHPMLLHASSKSTGQSRRRVLHFLFGPRDLPAGLRWHQSLS